MLAIRPGRQDPNEMPIADAGDGSTQSMTQPEIVRTRGEESREAILAAARQLFGQRGFRGTSLASIAEAAGLSQPGLLHHFPSKTDLLLAVLASRDASDGQMSSRLSGDIVDGLRT